eukprot:31038-Pelagococcus_subviridis.AAC.7
MRRRRGALLRGRASSREARPRGEVPLVRLDPRRSRALLFLVRGLRGGRGGLRGGEPAGAGRAHRARQRGRARGRDGRRRRRPRAR